MGWTRGKYKIKSVRPYGAEKARRDKENAHRVKEKALMQQMIKEYGSGIVSVQPRNPNADILARRADVEEQLASSHGVDNKYHRIIISSRVVPK